MSTVTKLEGSKVKLTIEMTEEALEAGIRREYPRAAKRYNIPGFRKGKAPRKVIENAYGPLVFLEDGFDSAYPALYEEAVKEHDIKPIDNPAIEIEAVRMLGAEDLPEGVAIRFSATVPVMPEVTLGQYKGIEVEKPEYNVTDEAVDSEIEKARRERARLVVVERPVENGDTVNLNYSGSVDGVKFDGGTAEEQELRIGSGAFIPGFEEQLVGMSIGEDKDITVTFPSEYHAPELAGKEAVFAIHINDISVEELPELNDDFAKDASDFETVEEWRNSERKKLEETAAQRAATEFENRAIEAAAANCEVEIPEILIERETDRMVEDFARMLSQQGLSIDMYMQFSGSDKEALRASYREPAEKNVRIRMMFEKLIEVEGIKATDEEIMEEVRKFADGFGDDAAKERFINSAGEDIKSYFSDRIAVDKAVKLIMDNVLEKQA